jgi:hypothetical protein
MAKSDKPGTTPVRVSAQDVEIYQLAVEENVDYKTIADQYGICEATVGRTVKRVRTYLGQLKEKGLMTMGANRGQPQAVTPAARPSGQQETGMSLIPQRGENFLDQIDDFARISRSSAATGVVVGCAANSIVDGFTNPNISEEEGLQKAAKGCVSLGSFIFGVVRSFDSLQNGNNRNDPANQDDRGQ